MKKGRSISLYRSDVNDSQLILIRTVRVIVVDERDPLPPEILDQINQGSSLEFVGGAQSRQSR